MHRSHLAHHTIMPKHHTRQRAVRNQRPNELYRRNKPANTTRRPPKSTATSTILQRSSISRNIAMNPPRPKLRGYSKRKSQQNRQTDLYHRKPPEQSTAKTIRTTNTDATISKCPCQATRPSGPHTIHQAARSVRSGLRSSSIFIFYTFFCHIFFINYIQQFRNHQPIPNQIQSR